MYSTNDSKILLGKHAIIDLSGCNQDLIRDAQQIRDILQQAVDIAEVTALGTIDHHFSPEGYTAVIALEESHLSIHTWPEYGHVSIDLYSCNLDTNFEAVKEFLAEQFQAKVTKYNLLERGCVPKPLEVLSVKI